MKILPFYFFLFAISSACSSMPENVKSWEIINPDLLNKKIQDAYKNNLEWANKPELYIFYLMELSNLKKFSYEYVVDNIENPKNININIVRDGFLDDSVRGDIQHIKLQKIENGIWKILSVQKAISCWRSSKLVYSSKACL